MRKYLLMLSLLLAGSGLVGCGGGGGGDAASSDGPQTRTVLVDYRHDETETSMWNYYPRKVTVRPGDTVEFEQAWTGEPHSVTFGAIIDPVLRPIIDLVEEIEGGGEFPPGEPEEFRNFNAPLALEEEEGISIAAQHASQPCYVAEATEWPGDSRTPCPEREQPEFSGTDAIYSSGLIPYEGVGGNTFRMPIAEDAKPGTYSYFCNVHGPLQFGEVEIVAEGAELPSSRDVAKAARREAEEFSAIMVANHKAARAGKPVVAGEAGDQTVPTKGKNLIGVPSPFFHDGKFAFGIINEFVPKNMTAKVGEKVTWTFGNGKHTISFNVPKYFPVFTIEKDGTVQYNEKVTPPAGWPAPPEPQEQGPPDDQPPPEGDAPPEGGGEGGGPPEDEEPVRVDAGTWDGKGFRSSGLVYPDGAEFSVTFTKAGTYPFACLIHPSMVGEIVVK